MCTCSPDLTKDNEEIRCCISAQGDGSKLEEQFRVTVQLNTRLALELGAAKKEIEILTARLKELHDLQKLQERNSGERSSWHGSSEAATSIIPGDDCSADSGYHANEGDTCDNNGDAAGSSCCGDRSNAEEDNVNLTKPLCR